MKIKTVALIGATGTMGANIAGIFASFGGAKVYCIGRNIEQVKRSIEKTVLSVKADSIRKNLIPADYSMLEECVKASDLVFESVLEDMEVKVEVANRVAAVIRPGTISCTGTSGLSIQRLAECYPEPQRSFFWGVHMFNPPYSMPLCEVIPTKYSDQNVQKELLEYLHGTLLRTVVKVKDSPAFLANRIGFQFINMALQYAEKYRDNGGIDYIDSILGTFTGRSMPPLVTADFVGLDVHKAIVDNLYFNTDDFAHNTFELPAFVEDLIQGKKLGRKTGEGLYKTIRLENGQKKMMVYDIKTNEFRERIEYGFSFSEEMKKEISNGNYRAAFECLLNNESKEAEICLSFLCEYIVYSVYSANLVGDSVADADDVMATGFNWCPPQALYKALSQINGFENIILKYVRSIPISESQAYICQIGPSKYDYRPFFKSGK